MRIGQGLDTRGERRRGVQDLVEKLQQYARSGTPAERKIAKYFSDHLSDLSVETAASIAVQLDLSPMTVGRFLRTLGYQGLGEIRPDSNDNAVFSAWQVNDHLDVLHKDMQDGQLLAEMMAKQIDALQQLHTMTTQPIWAAAVQAIISADEVFVASFHNIGGVARYFTEQLTYARDKVRYMDGQNGTYAELLGRDAGNSLLIVITCRRFASKSRTLARTAKKAGHKVLLITDPHCDWSREAADITLVLPTTRPRMWDSFTPLTALLDFLLTSVIVAGGEATSQRTRRISELQDIFGDFMRR